MKKWHQKNESDDSSEVSYGSDNDEIEADRGDTRWMDHSHVKWHFRSQVAKLHPRDVAEIQKKKKRQDKEQKYEEKEDGMGRQQQSIYIKE